MRLRKFAGPEGRAKGRLVWRKLYAGVLSACFLVGAPAAVTLTPSLPAAKAALAAHTTGCFTKRGVLYCTFDAGTGKCVLHPTGAFGKRPDTVSTPDEVEEEYRSLFA